jgi:hypothetical protein
MCRPGEQRLGAADVFDGLPRHRIGNEADEIAGMTVGERHADLAVVLHPAYAGSVAGARIENNEGTLSWVDLDVGRRSSP